MTKRLRVFISSPGDVGLERDLAQSVLGRLGGEFGDRFSIETIRWEDRPVRATQSFQPQIVPPSQTDIVLCILWSRLGTPLPDEMKRPDGTRFGSGTEWEFEDAVRGWREVGTPDLLVYRRTQDPLASIRDASQFQFKLQQYQALEGFVQKWFFGEDGTFKAAFKTYVSPDRFEKLVETDLRQLLIERLPQHHGEAEIPVNLASWHQGSPYSGLSPFTLDRASIFFGRTKAIAEVKEALVRQAESGKAFLVIFGMSGCGKSSLARAGILATLLRPGVVEGVNSWRWAILRPTDAQEDLCRVLAGAIMSATALPELTQNGVAVDELAAMLADRPRHAAPVIAMALRRALEKPAPAERAAAEAPQEGRTAKLILVVDQLEEIFTRDRVNAEQRIAFIAALGALARSGHVWILATMRSDFYSRCVEVPELIELKEGEGQYDLLPPSFDEIDQMIVYPTRAAGLRFEVDPSSGQRLDAALHEAAAKDPQALPLLSFTLDELYRRRSEEGFLTFEAYRELGGLEGALAQRAEEVLRELPREVQETLGGVMRSLVTVEPTAEGIFGARRIARSSVDTSPERSSLLEALIAARLLVTDRAETGESVVRVAHEALLKEWPRVRQLLLADQEFIKFRTRLTHQADRWQAEGKRSDLLLPAGRLLAEAEEALKLRREDFDAQGAEFVAASLRRRRRQRGVLLATTIALTCVLTLGAFMTFQKWDQWRRDRSITAEDREQNRRESLRLEFERTFAEARAEMLNPLPSSADSALKNYTRCREIALDLSQSKKAEEKTNWTIQLANVQLGMSDAYGKKAKTPGIGDDPTKGQEARKAMVSLLEERKQTLSKLPPDSQQAALSKLEMGTDFSRNRRIVFALQLELFAANEDLKQQMRGNEALKQALKERMSFPGQPSESQQPPQPHSKAGLTDQDMEQFADDQLKLALLMAQTSEQDEDWENYIRLVQILVSTTFSGPEYRDKAEHLFREAFHRVDLILQKALAPESAPRLNLPFAATSQNQQATAATIARLTEAPYRFQGFLGLSLLDKENRVYVDQAAATQPAGLAGLKRGDQIIAIAAGPNGELESVENLTAQAVSLKLRGDVGSPARLTVSPGDGGADRSVVVVRIPRPIDAAEAKWAAKAIVLHEMLANRWAPPHDPAKLIEICERGLSLAAVLRLAMRDPRTNQSIYNLRYRRANALHLLKQTPQAVEAIKVALAEATQADAAIASTAAQSVIDYRKLASHALARFGDTSAARIELENAIRLQRSILLAKRDSQEERQLAQTLLDLANLLEAEKQPPAIQIAPLREAFDLYGGLFSRTTDAMELGALLDVMVPMASRLATFHAQLEKKENAEGVFLVVQQGIAAFVSAETQSNEPGRHYRAENKAGKWQLDLGLRKQAIESYARAVELFEKQVEQSGRGRADLVADYFRVFDLARKEKDFPRAESIIAQARRLRAAAPELQNDVELHARLLTFSAVTAFDLKQLPEVSAWAQEAARLSIPLDDKAFMLRSGDELGRLYAIVTDTANKAGAIPASLEAARRWREVAQRMVELEVNPRRLEQHLLALDRLGDLFGSSNDLDQSASTFLAMQEAAAKAQAGAANPRFADLQADATDSFARVRMSQGKPEEADGLFGRAIDLWRPLCDSGKIPKTRMLSVAAAWERRASLAAAQKKWVLALQHTESRIKAIEQAQPEKTPTSQRQLASAYLSVSWYQLFNHQPQAAIEASSRALELAPDFSLPATNLISGYLLTDQFDKALEVYNRFKSKDFGDYGSLATLLQADFKELRNAGIDHPNFQKLEDQFAAKSPTP